MPQAASSNSWDHRTRNRARQHHVDDDGVVDRRFPKLLSLAAHLAILVWPPTQVLRFDPKIKRLTKLCGWRCRNYCRLRGHTLAR